MKAVACFKRFPSDCVSLHFILVARVLENCGAERLPRGSALWEGGHQYTWQWFPHRKVGTIFKVSSS